jgi:hypothetical protein
MTDSAHPPDDDPQSQIADSMSDLAEMDISSDMKALIERGLVSRSLPKVFRGARAAEAFQYAFELIGGVPRLALWADRNPDKFYPLLARMIPQTIAPVLPNRVDSSQQGHNPFPWVTPERIRALKSIEVAEDIQHRNVVPMVAPPDDKTGT